MDFYDLETSLAAQMLKISRNHSSKEMQTELEQLGVYLNNEQRYQVMDAPIILIRHGFSDYNYCMRKVKTVDKQKKLHIQTDINLIDSSLHGAGLIQLQNQTGYFHSFNIDIIFVSPMRRALQTAIILFKNHPNKTQLKFVVISHICEIVGDLNDFQVDSKEIIDEFTLTFQKEQLSIDFTLLFETIENSEIGDFWQQEVVENHQKRKQFVDTYNTTFQNHLNISREQQYAFLIDLFKLNLKQGILENQDDTFERAKVAKLIISQYLKRVNRYNLYIEEFYDIEYQKTSIDNNKLKKKRINFIIFLIKMLGVIIYHDSKR